MCARRRRATLLLSARPEERGRRTKERVGHEHRYGTPHGAPVAPRRADAGGRAGWCPHGPQACSPSPAAPRGLAVNGACLEEATHMVDSDDATLATAAANGSQQAWDQIVRRHERSLYAVGRAFRLTPEEISDATQCVWLRAFEHLGGLREKARLRHWL